MSNFLILKNSILDKLYNETNAMSNRSPKYGKLIPITKDKR